MGNVVGRPDTNGDSWIVYRLRIPFIALGVAKRMSVAKRLIDSEREFMLRELEKMNERISRHFDEIEGRLARLETAATVTPRDVVFEALQKLDQRLDASQK